jgi:putative transposase
MVSATAGFRRQETPMARISFKRHRFPPEIIRHAVWLYFRFTLSFRDVEEMLAQRGISASYETVRCWTIKFGPQIAAKLKRRRAPPFSDT